MWFNLLRAFVLCFLAAYFFAPVLSTPKRSAPIAAIIGAFGYLVFLIVPLYFAGGKITAYFFATTVMMILSELSAYTLKMPSTIFITVAVVPIVPGGGLYNTMFFMVQGKYSQMQATGFETFYIICVMAIAIALSSSLSKLVLGALFRRKKKNTSSIANSSKNY
ncbi:MAG: threonine/serine exporter family protein [Clostridia bacterium]